MMSAVQISLYLRPIDLVVGIVKIEETAVVPPKTVLIVWDLQGVDVWPTRAVVGQIVGGEDPERWW
jgi:hypothetical protein